MPKNKTMVVGFEVEKYNLDTLQSTSDHRLYEMALDDADCVIYDNSTEFFCDLNSSLIDTENMYWFILNR